MFLLKEFGKSMKHSVGILTTFTKSYEGLLATQFNLTYESLETHCHLVILRNI